MSTAIMNPSNKTMSAADDESVKEQKKIEQDEIWKQICKELDWDFIPTL